MATERTYDEIVAESIKFDAAATAPTPLKITVAESVSIITALFTAAESHRGNGFTCLGDEAAQLALRLSDQLDASDEYKLYKSLTR